jgi:hypothetical protein
VAGVHIPANGDTKNAKHQEQRNEGDHPSPLHGPALKRSATAPRPTTTTATTTSTMTTTIMTKTFAKAPLYDTLPFNLISVRDEAVHLALLKRVRHCFAPSVLLEMESVMRSEVALLLRAIEQRRGEAIDMWRWFRMFIVDMSGTIRESPISPNLCL